MRAIDVLLVPWTAALLVAPLWPSSAQLDIRVWRIPVEYLPFIGALVLAAVIVLRARLVAPPALLLPTAAVLIYATVSVLWVDDLRLFAAYLPMWVVYLTTFLLVTAGIAATPQRISTWWLDNLLVIGCLFGLAGIARSEAHLGVYPGDLTPFMRYRISEVLVLLPLVPVALARYAATDRLRYLWAAGVLSWAVCTTLSRTGMIGLAVVLLLGAWAYRHALFGSWYRVEERTLLVVLVIFAVAWPVNGAEIGARVLSMGHFGEQFSLGYVPDNAVMDFGALDHRALLDEGLTIWADHRWLGTGTGNYFIHAAPGAPKPHNLYVSYLAEWGIVGGALLFMFIAMIVWTQVRAWRCAQGPQRSVLMAFLIGNVSLLAMSFGTETVTLPYQWFWWGVGTGCALNAPQVGRGRSQHAEGDTGVGVGK